jgi:hypothetical protein
MSNIRTYKIKTEQNKFKNLVIYELYKEYKKYYRFQINKQYNEYLKTGRLNKFIETKNDKSKLSERYKRCVVGQVVGQLQSWISNRDNKIKEIIHDCESLTPEQKRKLHLIKIFNVKTSQEIIVKKEAIKITYEDIILFEQFKSNNLQCAVIGRNINHTSPDRSPIFLIHNPLNFEQFLGIMKSRK